MRRRTFMKGIGAAGVVSLGAAPAAGAPSGGSDATWTTGEQYGVGTVADHDDPDSRAWFALTEGALAGLRFPRIDLINVRTVDFLVADPDTGYAARTHNVSRTDDDEDTVRRRVEPTADDALLFRHVVTETADERAWTLTAEYAADPDGDAVLADVTFESDGGRYDVYTVVDPACSMSARGDAARVAGSEPTGNGKAHGRGARGFELRAFDTGAFDDEAVVLHDDGEPYTVALAAVADRGFEWATADVVGGDALSPLLVDGAADARYDAAEGNVALVGRLGADTRRLSDTVAVGFAEEGDDDAAAETAAAALDRGFGGVRAKYRKSWRDYLRTLDRPDSVGDDAQYDAAAMTLKAADSKQFPGAGLASPSVPWGDATAANRPSDYGYNFVWARDLYQAFTAMLGAGDRHSAREAVEYIYERQQDDSGFIPQNTYVDGRTRWGGEQMDNISFPAVMTYALAEAGVGFDDLSFGYDDVARSADYVAANGPESGQERWEEESGYSPSTIAAEIAGLACAAALADDEGERGDVLAYLGVADEWRAGVTDWTATTTGSLSDDPYFVRISDDADPDDGAQRGLANGGPTLDERAIVDAGFLELVRLGVLPADDAVVENSVDVVDDQIRVETPNGPAFYRYTGDGYGEQGRDESDSLPAGAPWGADGDNAGRGRLWPIFTGERGEYELLAGGDAAALLDAMSSFANDGRMIPEQVWDRPEPTDYGWTFGEGTGSATPLSWSMAQYVRLAHGVDAGEPVETPGITRSRYAEGAVPDGPSLDVQFPADVTAAGTATVSGRTDGEEVVVKTADGTQYVDGGGEFSVDVSVPDGALDVTVVAGTGGDVSSLGTTVARETVTGIDVGDAVGSFADPVGDDAGPGGYTYPTASVFRDGVFDIESFDVYETDDEWQFLYRLAGPLTNPWGGDQVSLQTFHVYLRNPEQSGGATAAREGVYADFEAPYHRRVVVEGFVQPRVEAADGTTVTTDVEVTGYGAVDAVKIAVPKTAVPDVTAAEFSPLLLGQDGYNTGRIRHVYADNGGYAFGGGRDDTADPNVIDLVTPDGVDNADALSYTADRQATIPYVSL
ncbi:glucodextranase DOMON-like domain-containing protein [Halobaculum sp. D14]|uniref:glucodextranase DOMON-like domain-containing protein n=1 Tax=Halobaculum sp. D14 TaxID=3421642 RepID=UPI003EB966A0